MFRYCILVFAYLGSLLGLPQVLLAGDLTIVNHCNREILNILLLRDSDRRTVENYLRLDLEPEGSAQVESQRNVSGMLLDDGLELVSFANVPLSRAKMLTFDGEACEKIKFEESSGNVLHLTGEVHALIPKPGEKIVCELSRFRPKMPMAEVCEIIPELTPKDDNGALLAGLGFAGLVWAGRLTPERSGQTETLLLEHMELRRSFDRQEVLRLIQHLYKQGYVPWQAEMPSAELDFADMPDRKTEDRKEALNEILTRYLDNMQKHTGEAIIMFAPVNILDALANSDEPERDVQLFTLKIKPKSDTVLLDVAAYEAAKS